MGWAQTICIYVFIYWEGFGGLVGSKPGQQKIKLCIDYHVSLGLLPWLIQVLIRIRAGDDPMSHVPSVDS